MPWQIGIEVLMPVWIPGVDITRTAFLRTSFKMLKKGSIQAGMSSSSYL